MKTTAKYEVSDVLDPEDGFVSGYSKHASLRSIPDCGEPDCIGECEHDREYEAYGKRLKQAELSCKVSSGRSTYCTCQLCESGLDTTNEDSYRPGMEME